MSDSDGKTDDGRRMGNLPPMPKNALPAPRRILIQRNAVPSTNQMVADAYHTLAAQLRHFKNYGDREKFDVREATAFNKLVTSVASLQELERKNAAMLELGNLSQAELNALGKQAQALLPKKDDD